MKGTRSFCAKCQEASFKEELGGKVDSKITLQSQKYNKYQRKGKKKELRPTTRLFAAVGSLCGPSGSPRVKLCDAGTVGMPLTWREAQNKDQSGRWW